MGSPHQIARPATVAVVSQTTATRISTRRWPSRRKNGSCRVERLRPFHWPRRASFLTGPNIYLFFKGATMARFQAITSLSFAPSPARLIFLISLDDRLDQRVPNDVFLAALDDRDPLEVLQPERRAVEAAPG